MSQNEKETKGFLTEKRREYLRLPPEEREKKYPISTRTQNDFIIKRKAKQALQDLILVASAYTEKRNHEIFTIEDMKSLLSAVIYKIGRETVEGEGPYYHLLINTIIDTLNRDPDGSHTHLQFQIIPLLYGYHPLNPPDTTNRYLRRYNQSSKK